MDEVLDAISTSNPKNFTRIREALSTAYTAGEKSVKDDLDEIWSKYHVNNLEDDGFRDSKDEVIDKFYAGMREQVEYFKALTTKHE